MDTPCLYCGEPWDTHHLREDEIHETVLSDDEKAAFAGKLEEPYLSAFEANGWEFAGSLYTILRCPCCKNHKSPAGGTDAYQARCGIADIATDMLGDDEDALVIALQDQIR